MHEIVGPWGTLLKPVEPLAFLVLRATVIYVVLVVLMRLAGKREIGQMTPFDLVLILLVANAAQNSMVGFDTSLTSGIISVIVLFGLNYLFGRLEASRPLFRRLMVGTPVLLVHNGQVIEDHLAREHLSVDDLLEQMREHGIARLENVAEAVLEPDGNFSFITRSAEGLHLRKKRAGLFGAHPGGTDASVETSA